MSRGCNSYVLVTYRAQATLNLGGTLYAGSGILSQLRKYINDIADIKAPLTRKATTINTSQIKSKEIILGVSNKATPQQIEYLKKSQAYAKERNIKLTIMFIE